MQEFLELLSEALSNFREEICRVTTTEEVEGIRVKYLGRSGAISSIASSIAKVRDQDRKQFGQAVNTAIKEVNDAILELKNRLKVLEADVKMKKEEIDVTIPGRLSGNYIGSEHIVSSTIQNVTEIFKILGYGMLEGTEVENDWYNFTALNMPEGHPARNMHDTFYVSHSTNGLLLRTHTTTTQIRYLSDEKTLPCKKASIGKVYRSDYDATHTPMFHQYECFNVQCENVSVVDMIRFVKAFLSMFFQTSDLPIRFRSSYFPFTEPSFEVDLKCFIDQDSGSIQYHKEGNKWIELLGCGLIHRNVLTACQIDSKKVRGFALGGGIERLAMLKHQICDIRQFFNSDYRWLTGL
ncbi:Phenylalanine--tRNA ligase alpha subunit [Candidatus Fokinia solitaria]|uniref:Phenylalanine--tRNA ligase alpha subunit n=1 Tax=Candidatus Fokinia solitaria TaxID=1802984 RepID=A0A2U8BRN0_9RICK|nr:phenylalanine--tRNA ligase subunit alpha [Candidatus Fokinia solitaria]AWD32995.1 Phenylalanine--tRNA ligase alpha subunit [Candidatus Fokinia solitaria]